MEGVCCVSKPGADFKCNVVWNSFRSILFLQCHQISSYFYTSFERFSSVNAYSLSLLIRSIRILSQLAKYCRKMLQNKKQNTLLLKTNWYCCDAEKKKFRWVLSYRILLVFMSNFAKDISKMLLHCLFLPVVGAIFLVLRKCKSSNSVCQCNLAICLFVACILKFIQVWTENCTGCVQMYAIVRYWLVHVCICVCVDTYSGKSPSTRHTYCFCTWRFRIWCSIWRAFFGLRPNSKRPDVRRSKRWIVRKFFKLNSFARMKTTVLWR